MVDQAESDWFEILTRLFTAVGEVLGILAVLTLITGYTYTARYLAHFGIPRVLLDWGSLRYCLQATWPLTYTLVAPAVLLAVAQMLERLIASRKAQWRGRATFALFSLVVLSLIVMVFRGSLLVPRSCIYLLAVLIPLFASGFILLPGMGEKLGSVRWLMVGSLWVVGVLCAAWGLADYQAARDASADTSDLPRMVLYPEGEEPQRWRLITFAHGSFYVYRFLEEEEGGTPLVYGFPQRRVRRFELKPPPRIIYEPPTPVGTPIVTPIPTPIPTPAP